jgi:hypothetical protein
MRDFNKDRYFQDWLRKQEEEKRLNEERRKKRIIQENRERRKRHQLMMQEQLMAQMAAFNDAVVNASGGSSGSASGGDEVTADSIVGDFYTAAGISDTGAKPALVDFVDSLIRDNLWDKMIAVYPFITDARDTPGTQAQFKYNLKDPRDSDDAYRLTFNGSVGVGNQGITSMGSAAYMNTHISSVGVFTDDRPTFGYSNITITDNRYGVIGSVIGTSLSYNYIQFTWPFSAGYRIDMDSSPYSTDILSGWDGTGTHIFSRMDDTNVRIISSDGSKQTRTIPIEGLATVEFTIGLKTGANEGINTNTISFVFFSNKLEDAEASTLQTAVDTLLTTLGRLV